MPAVLCCLVDCVGCGFFILLVGLWLLGLFYFRFVGLFLFCLWLQLLTAAFVDLVGCFWILFVSLCLWFVD